MVQTVPLRVTDMTLVARTTPDGEGVLAQVAHVNGHYDLALVQTDKNEILQPLPYVLSCLMGQEILRSH